VAVSAAVDEGSVYGDVYVVETVPQYGYANGDRYQRSGQQEWQVGNANPQNKVSGNNTPKRLPTIPPNCGEGIRPRSGQRYVWSTKKIARGSALNHASGRQRLEGSLPSGNSSDTNVIARLSPGTQMRAPSQDISSPPGSEDPKLVTGAYSA
jgi:hypothetical protein